jgi:hypothetical protein
MPLALWWGVFESISEWIYLPCGILDFMLHQTLYRSKSKDPVYKLHDMLLFSSEPAHLIFKIIEGPMDCKYEHIYYLYEMIGAPQMVI